MKKRFLSIFMVLALCLSLIPASLAAETLDINSAGQVTEQTEDGTYTAGSGTVTIEKDPANHCVEVTLNNAELTVPVLFRTSEYTSVQVKLVGSNSIQTEIESMDPNMPFPLVGLDLTFSGNGALDVSSTIIPGGDSGILLPGCIAQTLKFKTGSSAKLNSFVMLAPESGNNPVILPYGKTVIDSPDQPVSLMTPVLVSAGATLTVTQGTVVNAGDIGTSTYFVNHGSVVNNGTLSFFSFDNNLTMSDYQEQIKALNLTGSGMIQIETRRDFYCFTNSGSRLTVRTEPLDCTEYGNWDPDATLEDDFYHYDPSTKTLVLNDIIIKTNDMYALCVPAGTTIELRGKNVLEAGVYCLSVSGDRTDTVTITGTGSLSMNTVRTSGPVRRMDPYNLLVIESPVLLKGNAQVQLSKYTVIPALTVSEQAELAAPGLIVIAPRYESLELPDGTMPGMFAMIDQAKVVISSQNNSPLALAANQIFIDGGTLDAQSNGAAVAAVSGIKLGENVEFQLPKSAAVAEGTFVIHKEIYELASAENERRRDEVTTPMYFVTEAGVDAPYVRYDEQTEKITDSTAASHVIISAPQPEPVPEKNDDREPTYRPIIKHNEGGTVEVNPDAPYRLEDVMVAVKPQPGYQIGSMLVTNSSGQDLKLTEAGDNTWLFEQPLGCVTIHVNFEKIDLSFVDIPTGAWFESAVSYAYGAGLMSGTDSNHFSPDLTTSRGMVVTVLWKLAGCPDAANTAGQYTDVAGGSYYKAAVAWASENGIVSGYGNGCFGPDDSITREQLALILYHYIQTTGVTFHGDWSDLTRYSDLAEISEYAYDALCWCTAKGVMNGFDGMFNPNGAATRAQVAATLMNFCEAMEQ